MAALALAVGVTTWSMGAAFGLWGLTRTVGPIEVTSGYVGLAVTDLAPAGQTATTHQAATASTDALLLPLGPTEAGELLATPTGVAWSFDVALAASGAQGVDYTITPPTSVFASIAKQATLRVFPVQSPTECSVAAAPDLQPNLSAIEGIPAAYGGLKQATAHWCVTAVVDELKLGQYQNTATVTATGSDNSTVTAEDSWDAVILPDPAEEPADSGLTVTHTVTGP
jgi:hypothetical protein